MKDNLEIYGKRVFHGRWTVKLQREKQNLPSLQATTDSPESILPHQETRFLVVLVREQGLSDFPLTSILDLCGAQRTGRC